MYATYPKFRTRAELRGMVREDRGVTVQAPARGTLRRLGDPSNGGCNVMSTDGTTVAVRVSGGVVVEVVR